MIGILILGGLLVGGLVIKVDRQANELAAIEAERQVMRDRLAAFRSRLEEVKLKPLPGSEPAFSGPGLLSMDGVSAGSDESFIGECAQEFWDVSGTTWPDTADTREERLRAFVQDMAYQFRDHFTPDAQIESVVESTTGMSTAITVVRFEHGVTIFFGGYLMPGGTGVEVDQRNVIGVGALHFHDAGTTDNMNITASGPIWGNR